MLKLQLAGPCTKLSEGGWTTHKRFLHLSNNAITYYREVPKDIEKLGKPKQSVPLGAIINVIYLEA